MTHPKEAVEAVAKWAQTLVAADRWKGRDLSAAPPEKWHRLRPETQQFWMDHASQLLDQIAPLMTRTKVTAELVVCAACRNVGMLHCSDPVNCGNMKTQTDSWLSWLDDLPVSVEFDEGIGCLQEYITALRADLDQAEADKATLRIEPRSADVTGAPDEVWAWSFNDWANWGGYARGTNMRPLDAKEAATGAVYIRKDRAEADKAAAVPHLHDPDSHWNDFIESGVTEAQKAMRKFPQPNYVISKVAEEAGEVVKAAIHCVEGRESAENVRGEMRQLVAMLFRLWVEGDEVHGLPPVSAAIRARGDA